MAERLDRHFDVIVIGGGPAGSSAALTASKLNARVLLVERRRMPRAKLCGGWVTNRALEWLGFELDPAVVECQFRRVELRYGETGVDFAPESPIGIFVDRATFDYYLVQRAESHGVTVRFDSATSVYEENGKLVVQLRDGSVTGDGVILCTGANSSLVRVLRHPDTNAQSGVCMEQQVSADFADQLRLKPETARLYFGRVRFGYGWALHHGRYLIVGIGCRRSQCSDLKGLYNAFWNYLSLPNSLQVSAAHVIPFGGYRRVLGRRRLLSAGDAAGFVDSFNGEGISYAIRSGQLAAEALASTADSDSSKIYRDSCRDEILRHLRLSLWTARLYYKAPGLFLRSFYRNHSVLERYNEVLEGRLDYKRFVYWALVSRLGTLVGLR